MIFSFPGLKGYVYADVENNKLVCHDADPELKYMKLLHEIAKEWLDAWRGLDKRKESE